MKSYVYLATLRGEITGDKESHLEKRQKGKRHQNINVGVNTLPQPKEEMIGFK